MKRISWNVDKPVTQSTTLSSGCPEWHSPRCTDESKCKPQPSTRQPETLSDRYKKAIRRSFKNNIDLHSIESLLYYGCDVNTELHGGETALLAATYWRDVDLMTTLVDSYGAKTSPVIEKVSNNKSLKTFFDMFLDHRDLSQQLNEYKLKLVELQENIEVERKDVKCIISDLPPETDGKLLREMLARAIRQTERQHKLLIERDEMLRLLENPSFKRRRLMK